MSIRTPAVPSYRRAVRASDDHLLGGVAGGLALHLGLPTLWVRIGFIGLAGLGGLGIALYAGLWLLLPTERSFGDDAPGLASATRGGRRPAGVKPLFTNLGVTVPLLVLAFGLVLAAEAAFGSGVLFWPLVFAAGGLALLWRQADEAQRERWMDTGGRVDPIRAVLGSGGWAAYARLLSGGLLLFTGFVLFAWQQGTVRIGAELLIAVLLGITGLALTVGPWVFRLASDLTAERAERVRSQERADMAAHLHDSVLQTLALIQKNAHDATTVATLARAQERDLRRWLFDEDARPDSTVAAALRQAAAEVEDAHGVVVDVVAVGDQSLTEATQPIVLAAREAMVNAAKHAGTGRVDVYAEVGDGIDVFVRDRGVGFDTDGVAEDRQGVRGSIIDRMERHGGTAEIRSAPGEGTEVRLHLRVEETPA
ncbi:ATP-binding protein [Nocardioides limicola]|uniref:ATP-binding protein n=1 Tax=Nocardioides limicola TaxID=2803368 RepID=UPI00193C6D16|nr:ATP-binding protein [Nocardioides sp. DJM-14]